MESKFKITTVKKWGHSFVLLVPKDIRAFLGVEHGDIVGFRKCGRYIVIKKLAAEQSIPLTENEARAASAAAGD